MRQYAFSYLIRLLIGILGLGVLVAVGWAIWILRRRADLPRESRLFLWWMVLFGLVMAGCEIAYALPLLGLLHG